MQSTQPSSEEWDDDAVKMLLAYGGWRIEWSDEDQQWLVTPPRTIFSTLFMTLKDVHEYYLNHMKWFHDAPKPNA